MSLRDIAVFPDALPAAEGRMTAPVPMSH